MNNKQLILTVGISGMAASAAMGAISITPTSDANVLANTIAGPGLTINSAVFTGAAGSAGTFTGGLGAGLGIQSGIVLTSGAATIAGEQNTFDDRTQANGFAGSPLLDAVLPVTSFDAATLTIEFTLDTGGDLFFNYVFGSEEYDEYVGSNFNDVFGFFLDGTTPLDNIAIVPGSGDPVAINTVNDSSNSAFYRDNDISTIVSNAGNEVPVNPGDAPYPLLQYDGLTTVLTASALGIGAGTHTITLVIGDAGDEILDSGVYIQAGSFSTEQQPPTVVPEGNTVFAAATLGLLGAGALWRRQRRATSAK